MNCFNMSEITWKSGCNVCMYDCSGAKFLYCTTVPMSHFLTLLYLNVHLFHTHHALLEAFTCGPLS